MCSQGKVSKYQGYMLGTVLSGFTNLVFWSYPSITTVAHTPQLHKKMRKEAKHKSHRGCQQPPSQKPFLEQGFPDLGISTTNFN